MIEDFENLCINSKLRNFCPQLINLSRQAFGVNNGNIPKWEQALSQLKQTAPGKLDYQAPYLSIDTVADDTLEKTLKQLSPWRKGPYQIGSVNLDSEWQGDLKWNRVLPHIKPLEGKTILDVGSGNGFFTHLMALEGAQLALGIEPFLLFNYQFHAIRNLIKNPPNAFVLPLRLQQMPKDMSFDTIFSMGVLYHQKNHMEHLIQLKSMMNRGAELILETLIIDKEFGSQIIPQDRYARMRNVWCLPSTDTVLSWLKQAGFQAQLVDITKTTPKEQRATRWIGENTQSLADFLDPNNDNLTVEGLPAPKRAIFICRI